MEIKARRMNTVIILDLFGRVDVDSANLVEIVGQCIADGFLDVLCNFEGVEFIDYMGISAICIAYKDVLNHNGRMKFVNIPIHLRGLFSIAGLDKSIEMYSNEELAVNSFQEDRIIEKIQKIQLRRRFKRLPIEIRVELKNKHDCRATCLKAELLDLSAIGAYIYGCQYFKLGEEIILKLKLPNRPKELELNAKVVWLSDKEIQNQIHPGMGVEFTNMPTDIQEEIIKFIEKNLSYT